MSFVAGGVAYAAGTPHTSWGIVSGGQTTDSWKFYVVSRPTEIQTGSILEQAGQYYYQVQVNLASPWSEGDDSIVFVARSSGYYAVMNQDLTNQPSSVQQYNNCTMRKIPDPTATAGAAGSGKVTVTWSQAGTDTSATPQGNNIASFNVYRSTSASSGFTKIGTKTGNTATNTYSDTSGTAGTTYYYKIEPVFRGGVALGVQSAATAGVVFPTTTSSLNITTTSLAGGKVGTAYSATLAASGGSTPYTWSISSGTLPAGLSLSGNKISGTPTTQGTSNFTVKVTDNSSATDTQALSITISPATTTGPSITGVSTTSAYVGQTLTISGSGFGSTQGSSTVTVGGKTAKPTSWSDTSITFAVPSGVTAGSADIAITVSGNTDTYGITVVGGGSIIDDYEGGAVSDWVQITTSGYYVFDKVKDITPDKDNISAELRKAEAKMHGSLGAKVLYSYDGTDGTDWGGGWGAALVSAIDLSSYDKFSFFINWDGSSNDITLSFKDSDGTAYSAKVSNTTLTSISGYGQITINKSSFSYDSSGSDASADSTFSWSSVTNYNFVYNTQGTSTNYQYIDSISAGDVDWGGGGSTVPTGEVTITTVDPSAGPAGTKFTVTGTGFNSTQGQSSLIFENQQTSTSYAVEILSWSATSIEAIVPRLATAGSYKLKVVRIAITQGTVQAYESNPASFQVTAGSSSDKTAVIFPNPFNPLATGLSAKGLTANMATIAYNTTGVQSVVIYIYDLTGRQVYREVTTSSQIAWDGRDSDGNYVADGVYLLRIANNENKSLIAKGKILLIKK
jgi:hypothetical protein